MSVIFYFVGITTVKVFYIIYKSNAGFFSAVSPEKIVQSPALRFSPDDRKIIGLAYRFDSHVYISRASTLCRSSRHHANLVNLALRFVEEAGEQAGNHEFRGKNG